MFLASKNGDGKRQAKHCDKNWFRVHYASFQSKNLFRSFADAIGKGGWQKFRLSVPHHRSLTSSAEKPEVWLYLSPLSRLKSRQTPALT
jgi:hypothetical protein